MEEKKLTDLENKIADEVYYYIKMDCGVDNRISTEISEDNGFYVDIRGSYELCEVYDKDTDCVDIIGASVSLDIEALDKDENKIEINTSAIEQEVEKSF